MEKIVDHINKANLKQENLWKSLNQTHGEASSILSFTRGWKDVEDQLELAKFSLLNHGHELDLKAKKIAEATWELEQRDKQVELKSDEVEESLDGLQSENKHISLLRKWMLNFFLDLTSKEKYLNLAQKDVEDCNEMLQTKRRELELVLEDREECNKELTLKKQQLDTIEKSIEERSEELKSNEAKLGSVRMELEECSKELSVKIDQLESVLKSFQVCSHQLEVKEKEVENAKISSKNLNIEIELKEEELTTKKNQLATIAKSIEQGKEELQLEDIKFLSVKEKLEKCCQDHLVKTEQLELVLKELNEREHEVEKVKNCFTNCKEELELKQKELAEVNNSISECNSELEGKQKQLNTLQGLTNELATEVESKMKKVSATEKSIHQCKNDLDLKKKEFDTTQRAIQECLKELDLKHKKLTEVQEKIIESSDILSSKEKQCGVINTEISNCSEVLKVKQKSLDSVSGELESKQKQHDANNAINRCSMDLSVKQTEVQLIEKSIIDLKKNLASVKMSLKECCNDLASKKEECDSMRRTTSEFHKELEEKKKQFDALKTDLEERSTKLEMKEKQFEARVKEFELKEQQVDALYQNRQAIEPPEQKSHLQACGPDNSAIAKSQSSTSINENAPLIVLSDDGDPDLVPDEVLAELKSSKDPADFVLSLMQESYKTSLLEKLMEISPKISLIVQTKAIKLAVSWKSNLSLGTEKSMEVWSFLLFLAAYQLVRYFGGEEILRLLMVVTDQRHASDICRQLRFTDKIPEIIQILMERKQHIDAVRFSCAFRLLHMFPLDNILQICVDHIQDTALDEELSALKAILQCISDYKLEFRYDAQNTRLRIRELEMQKRCSRSSSLPLVHALGAQPAQQSGYHQTVDVSSSKKQTLPTSSNQPQPHNQKFRDRMYFRDSNKRPRN